MDCDEDPGGHNSKKKSNDQANFHRQVRQRVQSISNLLPTLTKSGRTSASRHDSPHPQLSGDTSKNKVGNDENKSGKDVKAPGQVKLEEKTGLQRHADFRSSVSSELVVPQLRGFTNPPGRHWCYMNSALQALGHLPGFISDITSADKTSPTDRVSSTPVEKRVVQLCRLDRPAQIAARNGWAAKDRAIVLSEMATLFSSKDVSSASVSPKSLWKEISRIDPNFQNNQQHDSFQFINKTLETIWRTNYKDQAKSSGAGSHDLGNPFSQLLAVRETARECLSCGTCSKIAIVDVVSHITAGLIHSDVQGAVDQAFGRDEVDFFCENDSCPTFGEPGRSSHQTTLLRSPSNMIIQFNRFDAVQGQTRFVDRSIQLNRSFSVTSTSPDGFLNNDTYHLRSVVVHNGVSTSAGHYFFAQVTESGLVVYNDDIISRHPLAALQHLSRNVAYAVYEKIVKPDTAASIGVDTMGPVNDTSHDSLAQCAVEEDSNDVSNENCNPLGEELNSKHFENENDPITINGREHCGPESHGMGDETKSKAEITREPYNSPILEPHNVSLADSGPDHDEDSDLNDLESIASSLASNDEEDLSCQADDDHDEDCPVAGRQDQPLSPAEVDWILNTVEEGASGIPVLELPPYNPKGSNYYVYKRQYYNDLNFCRDQVGGLFSDGVKRWGSPGVRKQFFKYMKANKIVKGVHRHVFWRGNKQAGDLVLIHYLGPDECFSPKPHGNDRKGKPFASAITGVGDRILAMAETKFTTKEIMEKNVRTSMIKYGSSLKKQAPVDTVRNTRQVRYQRGKAALALQIDKDEVFALLSMASTPSGRTFIHKSNIAPFQFVVADQDVLQFARNVLQESAVKPALKQLISYDTTFQLGDTYVSPLVIRNIYLQGDPIFSAAFYLHQGLSEDDHKDFWNKIVDKLNLRETYKSIPFISDKEEAIRNAIRKELPGVQLYSCHLHLIDSVKRWLTKHQATQSTKSGILAHLGVLLASPAAEAWDTSFEEYRSLWPRAFREYFEKHQLEDFKKSSKFNYDNCSAFDAVNPTTNTSESENARIKRFTEGREQRVDTLVLMLRQLQLQCMTDFYRSFGTGGTHTPKTEYIGMGQKFKLPGHAELDWKAFAKVVKSETEDKIVKGDVDGKCEDVRNFFNELLQRRRTFAKDTGSISVKFSKTESKRLAAEVKDIVFGVWPIHQEKLQQHLTNVSRVGEADWTVCPADDSCKRDPMHELQQDLCVACRRWWHPTCQDMRKYESSKPNYAYCSSCFPGDGVREDRLASSSTADLEVDPD